ncbi:MAG: hypothetical protein JWL60_1292, partial [Gemmatimonadetes bacterium]|nr:hypothetical protein [Gemmatimonadota bacterium]
MPVTPALLVRRALLPVAAAALLAGCRDREPAPESPLSTDSSLAQDLAMARRDGPGPMVFNDAPLDATAPAASSARAPAPAPPRTRLP